MHLRCVPFRCLAISFMCSKVLDMESSSNTPRCKSCGHAEFILVGAFVVSENGITYSPAMQLNALTENDYSLTRELLECKGCNKKMFLTDCEYSPAQIVVRWETTDKNTRKAIVCPKCQNRTHFVRNVIRAFTVSEYVKIELGNITEVETGDEAKLDEVVISYACNVTGCDGSVELRSSDYRLTKS